MLLGDKADAGGTVAQGGAGIRTFAVSAPQLTQLHGLAKQAGFPVRTPDVQPRNDTSDGWSQVLLYVALDGTSRTLELSLLSSGFEGPDSSRLKAFLAALLQAADVKDESILLAP